MSRSKRLCIALASAVALGQLGPSVAQGHSPEVVITGKRHLTDDQMTHEVETALANDPYIYAEHITVTTRNGIVTLEGVVGDAGELLRVLRLCRKTSGARRVVDELEINAQLPDGG